MFLEIYVLGVYRVKSQGKKGSSGVTLKDIYII
jgi:hypothetical protein